MKKSNYVVWPAPSSIFLKMARGPKSLAIPEIDGSENGEKRTSPSSSASILILLFLIRIAFEVDWRR